MLTDQEKEEYRVFQKFLKARNIQSKGISIKNQKPPKPDLRVRFTDQSIIEYEIVELLDQKYGRLINILFDIDNYIRAYYKNLKPEEKNSFQKKFGNAIIFFRFFNGANIKKRKSVIPNLFSRLLMLTDGFEGDTLENDSLFKGVLESVSISRGSFKGPLFNAPFADSISDPVVSLINKKLRKQYDAQHPIELLAYINLNPMLPNDVWLENLRIFLDGKPKPLPFQKIWVFDLRKCIIKLDYPGF